MTIQADEGGEAGLSGNRQFDVYRRNSMKKRFIGILVYLLIAALVLASCAKEDGPEDVYREYMEAAKSGYAEAQPEFCHFENSEYLQVVMEQTDYVIDYEIISVEPLSEKLWAVNAKTVTLYHKDTWYSFTNFVGLIDGKYKVMVHEAEIPAELKTGIDLQRFSTYSTEPVGNK